MTAASRGSSMLALSYLSSPCTSILREARLLSPWQEDEKPLVTHRSALVRKDPDHYRPLFGDVPPDLPYVWPDGPPAG